VTNVYENISLAAEATRERMQNVLTPLARCSQKENYNSTTVEQRITTTVVV
jgi:hypothetical protein